MNSLPEQAAQASALFGLYPDSRLILVATVHGDPQGYARAVKLLEYLRPDLITVEISRFSVRYRKEHEPRWQGLLQAALARLPDEARSHLSIRRVAAQIEMPFEYRATRDYGRRYGIPRHAIDLSGPARRHLPRYDRELLSSENLENLSKTPDGSFEELVTAAYRRARLAEGRPLWRLPGTHGETARRRERAMASHLRNLAGRGQRVVHLGGWEHMVRWEDGGGLHAMLQDLQPVRFLLDDSDWLV